MSARLVGILVDSFGKILLPGLTVTIPLTVISFTLALIIAVVVALVQFAHVPVLQQIARFYIWVMRTTGSLSCSSSRFTLITSMPVRLCTG